MTPHLFVIRQDRPEIKDRAVDFILDIDRGIPDYDISIGPHVKNRTKEQNALGHVIATAIADQVWLDGRRWDLDSWWIYIKKQVMGFGIKELPDGSFIEVEPRSNNTSTKTFSDFIEYLYYFAAEHGVVIPDYVHSEYRRVMGGKRGGTR